MRKKPINPLVFIFGLAIILSILFMIFNQKKNETLPVYQGGTAVSEEEVTEKPIDITVNTYLDDSDMYSVSIPDGWERVNHGKKIEFVHAPSRTSVTLELMDYDPTINDRDTSSVSSSYVEQGYSFVSYEKTSNASSETIYQKDKTFDYILEEFWCKNGIVKILFTLEDANYQKMEPYLNKVLQSFEWGKKADVIPEGYYLYYMDFGDFEFSIPNDWAFSAESGVIYLSNPDNTAQMVLKVAEYSNSLSEITSYDLTELLKPGRENGFMIRNSSSSINQATADITYLSADGINMVNKTYLFANGYYLYQMQFDYVSNSIDESIPETCASLFRQFVTEKIANTPTEEASTESTEQVSEQASEQKYTWHKTKKGTWYGNKDWYPKNEVITIDGKQYRFDKDGYLVE